jgi:hypothetical protein
MDFSQMGGDCTNFISQCLVAGGLTQKGGDMGWYYKSPSDRAAAFSGVEYLYNYLIQNKVAREVPIAQLQAGDIIQLSFDGEKFSHSLLVLSGGADPKVATHSIDSYNRALSSYTYQLARGLHIIV